MVGEKYWSKSGHMSVGLWWRGESSATAAWTAGSSLGRWSRDWGESMSHRFRH